MIKQRIFQKFRKPTERNFCLLKSKDLVKSIEKLFEEKNAALKSEVEAFEKKKKAKLTIGKTLSYKRRQAIIGKTHFLDAGSVKDIVFQLKKKFQIL